MSIPTVDPFLVPHDSSEPVSTWNINSGSVGWNFIARDPRLQLTLLNSDGPVLTVSAEALFNLTFSNSANPAIFGDDSPLVVDAEDLLAQGAVLGLVTPLTTPLPTNLDLQDVLPKFGYAPAEASGIRAFLDAVPTVGLSSLTLDTTAMARNALWAISGQSYKIVVSLQFEVMNRTTTLPSIQEFLNTQLDLQLSLNNDRLEIRLTMEVDFFASMTSPTVFNSALSLQMDLNVQTAQSEVVVRFTSSQMRVAITDRMNQVAGTGSIYQHLLGEVFSTRTRALNLVRPSDLPDPTATGAFNQVFSSVDFWYAEVGKAVADILLPPPTTVGSIFWRIGLLGEFKLGPRDQRQVVGLVYDTRLSMFTGRLLFVKDQESMNEKRQYSYATWTEVPPDWHLPTDVDFATIFGVGSTLRRFPSHVTAASMYFSRRTDGLGYTVGVSAEASSAAAASGSSGTSAPSPGGLSWDTISIDLMISHDDSDLQFAIQLSTTFKLSPDTASTNPNPGTALVEPTLHATFEYSSVDNRWILMGEADNVPITCLSSFFSPSESKKATAALGYLVLRRLSVLYTFNNQGDPSTFLITGTLTLGLLELDLFFQYTTPNEGSSNPSAASLMWPSGEVPNGITLLQRDSSKSQWSFDAFLGSSNPSGSNLGAIISSIYPKSPVLPSFVAGIPIEPASGPPGSDSLVKLRLQEVGTNLTLIVQVSLFDLKFLYLSLWTDAGSKSACRVSVDKIPTLSSVPILANLPQPFDELLYLYVQDDSTPSIGGFNESDLLSAKNQLTPLSIRPLEYKETNTGASTAMLRQGHHFMVVQKGVVVLDHLFGEPEDQATPAASSTAPLFAETSTDAPAEGAPTKGQIDVQLPFLSIDAVTLQFKNSAIIVDIDATMTLGPVKMSVIGFEIALNLTHIQLNHLENTLTNGALTVALKGLALNFQQTPLQIAGVFIHDTVDGSDGSKIERYMGGLGVGFEAWQFLAVGSYAIVRIAQDEFKSIFIYAKLNGPLLSLGYATISGVRLGLGFNSSVRSPTMIELPHFPFLDGSAEGSAGNDPMKILTQMIGAPGSQAWVTPKKDSYWLAAGLTLTAFGMLSVTAVLMLGLSDSGVVITVVADGIAQMPPDVTDPNLTLFYVELYMLAELNFVDGFFTVQASLAPSSHVLVPSCRLTGGFALVNWFSPNPHAGDFVFTVGGYHPTYVKPEWYPPADRLGISFTLGSMINVTGYVYFAITPKCVMGGGGLHMGLDVGPVSAWLDIALDVFIQFKPFHYTADLRVSVGCAISIKVWFVHVRISASVGAALHIEGPDPFGGTANVDFYLFSFTIHFGGNKTTPNPLSLFEFYQMLRVPGPSEDATAPSAISLESQHKYVLTAGIYQPPVAPEDSDSSFPDSGSSSVWLTKAGTFAFDIGCEFALSNAFLVTVANPLESTPVTSPLGFTDAPTFWSKPMHANAFSKFSSIMYITVWTLDAVGTRQEVVQGLQTKMIMKDVPTALWNSYDKESDPLQTKNPPALKTPDNPTMSLCMGISLEAPQPYKVPSPIQDFDLTIAFRHPIPGSPYPHPVLQAQQESYLPSSAISPTKPPQDRWDEVAAHWRTTSRDGLPILSSTIVNDVVVPGLLEMAADVLGWNQPSPSRTLVASETQETPEAQQTPWLLRAAVPSRLLDDLTTQYPVLPRYTPGSRV